MRNVRWIFGLLFLHICGALFASCGDDCKHFHHKQNQLLPDLRIFLAPSVKDAAFSFLGEGGRRHWRANGTIGYAITNEHQLKIGGEYLSQRLIFGFGSGNEEKWVNQWAVGGKYRYVIDQCWVKSLDAFLNYSHSDSYKLKDKDCPFDSDRFVRRRIAGAENLQFGIGTSLILCHTGLFNFGLNFEDIHYKKKFHSKRYFKGLGGYLGIEHRLLDQFFLSLRGEFYEAYNFGEARLIWLNPILLNGLTVGLFGNYTQGKNRLPSAAMFGIEIGFNFNAESCCGSSGQGYYGCAQDGWLAQPAVYIPEVLAVADQKVRHFPECLTPTSDPIPAQVISTFPTTIDITQYFHGNGHDLIYTFNPSSGNEFVTTCEGTIVVFAPVNVTITVTGTNKCGSTVQTVQISTVEG